MTAADESDQKTTGAETAEPSPSNWGKIAATVVICLFLGTYLHTGLKHKELYPFSSFPMYSSARKKAPYSFSRYELEGVLPSGERVKQLGAPLGPAIFFKWQRIARNRKDDRLMQAIGEAVLDYNSRVRAAQGANEPLEKVIIYRQRWVVPWPQPHVAKYRGRKGVSSIEPTAKSPPP